MGLKVGYSVRNFKEIISFSKKDHTIKTTILDARVIVGSKNRFKEVISNYKVAFSKNTQKFLKEKILEKKKIKNLGFDYFRNEPNLKDMMVP